MSEWLKSDVFIIFVVVLLITVIAIVAVCCCLRRRGTSIKTKKMAVIEITPLDFPGRSNTIRFTLKIITEQKHASEIVQMLTGQIPTTGGRVCSTDLGISVRVDEVSSNSQTRVSSSHTDSALLTEQQAVSLDLQTTNLS
ncbi:hypothetical protein C0J50_6758 [Silurus asotus]|uniref:Uncharacterized protein n=1 Tax=Silurus asotus TaxID=30991 RepID=A0AAD5A306_SILAS|nr:hypothetical protein C0J50_6758 [Silurus asotus]